MQKPDADGFVNITWPSNNIPHGGIFHTRRAQSSLERQEFLKVLLDESKMTIAQRRKSEYRLRQEEEQKPRRAVERMPMVRPRTSKRRSLSAIRESGIYDHEPYKPMKRGEDREKLKDKLANSMAYGDSPEQVPPPPPAGIPKPKPKLPTEKEMWHDLLTQIRERAEWLAEMEDLGQGEVHREIIEEQIAERIRAMDALGVDSECSTLRSGFSTTRSREQEATARSNASSKSKASTKSNKSKVSDKSAKMSAKANEKPLSAASQEKPVSKHSPATIRDRSILNKEENVTAYGHFTPLKYTPRRRV